MKLYNKILSMLCILSAMTVASCTKYDNPPPVFEELKDLTTNQRKVMVISIDGLGGTSLQKIAPPQIMALQKNSKFAYNTLKTETGAAGWASMLTGTGYAKHKISNDDFEADQNDDNHQHENITSYRNVLDYVTQYRSVKTAIVTPWEDLRNFVKIADFAPVVSNDVQVKDSTLNILGQSRALGTMIVNFKDVEKAGENGGFNEGNVNFKNAVLKTDEYVGNIVNAIKARENYEKEDWLIIITTNHGGGADETDFGFTMAYNPAFQEFKLQKSGFNPVRFDNKTGRATFHDETGRFDVGENKSFTVQMDVKFNNVPGGYSSFFGKSTNLSGQNITGWQWAHYPGGKWVVTVGGTLNGGSGKQEVSSEEAPGTGVWRNLIMTVEYVNSSTRTLSMYMDGKFQKSINISARKSLNINEDLRVGHRAGDNDVAGSFSPANLVYYNTALSASTITNNYGLKDLTKHPNYADIIGYWPMDEGTGGMYFGGYPGTPNMALSGSYVWLNMGDSYPSASAIMPVTSSLSIPTNATDIAALTLYWMNIEILADFGMDGNPYLENFEIEFLKD